MKIKLAALLAGGALSLMLAGAADAAPVLFQGDYYEFVSDPGVNHGGAAAYAGSQTYLGVTGHLAVITSAAEDAFVQSLGGGWLGGSRSGSTWSWDDGEGVFWNGASGGSGTALYANWDFGEPNNSGGNEPFLLMRSNGAWQDYNGSSTDVGFFVVEFDTHIPEPATLALLGLGLVGLAFRRRKST